MKSLVKRYCQNDSLAKDGLLVFVAAVLLLSAFYLHPGLNTYRLAHSAVLALALAGLLEVVRSYWTQRQPAWSPGGLVRCLALWFGLWVLLYVAPDGVFLFKKSEGDSGGADTVSLVTTVLSFVLALTTLVATKVAADAKTEILEQKKIAQTEINIALRSMQNLILTTSLNGLHQWRFDIREALEQVTDPKSAASLAKFDKVIKAIRAPIEQLPQWGSSALDLAHLLAQSQQALTLLDATPDWTAHMEAHLKRKGAAQQMRALGQAVLTHLDLIKAQQALTSEDEHKTWNTLAALGRALTLA